MNFNKNSELTIPEKVKLILNEIIYVELGLQKIEEIFVNAEINNKTIINTENYKLCSKYFFLLNDVYLERLNESEQSLLKYYLDNLNSDNLNVKQELYNFLSERKIKLLLPETNERYLYWGGTGFQNIAPSDAIVLAFHYLKYGQGEEEMDIKETIIVDSLNYIQEVLAPSKNLKVRVIAFDEVAKNMSNTIR